MILCFRTIFIIASCLLVVRLSAGSLREEREADFALIQDYELVKLNLKRLKSQNILELDAYGQHYTVQLQAGESISPQIRHQTLSKLRSESRHPALECHYRGRVLNTNYTSVVSLSLCDSRGVRGMIRAFGYSLYIYPSAYFLNSDPRISHSLTDEHLVYRWLDRDYQRRQRHSQWSSMQAIHQQQQKQRRLIYNNGFQAVELYLVADKEFVRYFKDEYGESLWYRELLAYLSEIVALTSAEYEAGAFDDYVNVGIITLRWVELDIIEYWTGSFYSLKCKECYYDGREGRSGYLRKFADWSIEHKDVSNFDVGVLYSREESVMAGGTAYVGTICNDAMKYAVCASPGTMSRQRKLLAHELGHTLGMEHDDNDSGTYKCFENPAHIMASAGDYNTGWSSCSYKYLRDFFWAHPNQVTCLAHRANEFTSNFVMPTPKPTAKPTPKPTFRPTVEGEVFTEPPTMEPTALTFRPTKPFHSPSPDCVLLIFLNFLSGEWVKVGLKNRRPVYAMGDYFLYTLWKEPNAELGTSFVQTGSSSSSDSDSGDGNGYFRNGDNFYWLVGTKIGEPSWELGFCSIPNLEDITQCDFKWISFKGKRDKNGEFDACGALHLGLPPCLEQHPYEKRMCFHLPPTPTRLTQTPITLEISAEEGCLNEVGIYKSVQESKDYFLTLNDFGQWVFSEDDISVIGSYVCENSDLNECMKSGSWKQWYHSNDAEKQIVVPEVTVQTCPELLPSPDDEILDQNIHTVEERDRIELLIEELVVGIAIMMVIGCTGMAVYLYFKRRGLAKEVRFDAINEDEEVNGNQEVSLDTQHLTAYH